MSRRLNVTLLGHKDHGKSTLIGRLLHDTGSAKEDRIREVEETSRALGKPFEHAFLLDAFQEEREGGMTIDVIHAQIQGARYHYDCIDVPGHKELVRNMLTGASHADAGVLIVSVHEGIEEQTSHHLRLARWLGLEQLVVAVNKMDLAEYDEKAFATLLRGVEEILTGLGPSPALAPRFVPLSARTGENVVARSQRMGWYRGPTLLEAMERLEPPSSASALPLRLPVQGVLPGPDGLPLLAGRVESGAIEVGQEVRFSPSGLVATVRELHRKGSRADRAEAGENVGLRCEPQPATLRRGEVCAASDSTVQVVSSLTVPTIFLVEPPESVEVECGTARTTASLAHLGPLVVGEVSPITLRLREPIVVERTPGALGRVALKSHGRIVGVATAR